MMSQPLKMSEKQTKSRVLFDRLYQISKHFSRCAEYIRLAIMYSSVLVA